MKAMGRMQLWSSRYSLPHWTEKSHDKPVTIISVLVGIHTEQLLHAPSFVSSCLKRELHNVSLVLA